MFNKDKNASVSEKNTLNSATLISNGTAIQGDVASNSDLRIDGTVKGNVSCAAKIIVGPSGMVEGNIEGRQADITGKVIGNISVKEILQLRSDSNVLGNLSAATLQVDSAAIFNGECKMGVQEPKATMPKGSVVVMNEPDVAAKAK